jgi:hypothetical protein
MITETTPLNQWPIDSLIKLKALLEVNMDNKFIPQQNTQWYNDILSAVDKSIEDAKFQYKILDF